MGIYRYSPEKVALLLDDVARGVPASTAGKAMGIPARTAAGYVERAKKMGRAAFLEEVKANFLGFSDEAPVASTFAPVEEVLEIKHKFIAPDPDPLGRLILPKLPDVVMIIPDLQFPYAHPDALAFLSMVAQRYAPDAVVGIGDEVDAYFLSAYDKDPDALEGAREYEMALEQCERLFKLFPKAYGLHSNHGRGRLEKARIRGGLLRSMVPDYQTFIGAPRGWGFYDEVRLGDVLFHHGDGEKALNRPYLERHVPAEYGKHYSVVHGHRHEMAGRQAEISVGDEDYWCAYTGALINPRCAAFAYTKARKAKLGCGVIIHGEFKKVRLKVNDIGRWVGEL